MGRRRVRVNQGPMGKASHIIFTIVSFFFIILGVTMVIPGAGLFGVIWTLVAVCFFAFGVYGLVTGKGIYNREIIIEDDDAAPLSPAAGDAEGRLARLEDLYNRRVITREEYEAQRAEIIKDI